jgi:hypothetical protein
MFILLFIAICAILVGIAGSFSAGYLAMRNGGATEQNTECLAGSLFFLILGTMGVWNILGNLEPLTALCIIPASIVVALLISFLGVNVRGKHEDQKL